MGIIKLSDKDINLLQEIASGLTYNPRKNLIQGLLSFDLQFEKNGVPIKDKYEIEIDLNKVDQGLPLVRETGKRIRNLAYKKNMILADLHINSNDEMCMIIPPKIKERYPNGFHLETLIYHIQEHLYYISFIEKYNREPWKGYGHGDEGYLDLYLENKEKYSGDFKKYFHCASRPEFRRKIKEIKKVYRK
jgi:hypothetical protein